MEQTKKVIKIGQLELTFLLNGDKSDDSIVLFEFLIPSGAKVPVPHYHKDVDEVVYGLEGVTTSTIDGHKIEIGPGDRVFIPKGVTHHHDNHTANNAKSLVILTPANINIEYFKELSDLIEPGLPPDPKKISETMIKHGLIPVI